MGRPAAAEERRARHLGVRLTPAELSAIEAAAIRAGSPASVWARDTVLAAASTPPRLPTPARREQAAAAQELAVAVRRVGVNINQVARQVNLAPADVAKILASSTALAAFSEMRDLLTDTLLVLEDLRPSLRREARRC